MCENSKRSFSEKFRIAAKVIIGMFFILVSCFATLVSLDELSSSVVTMVSVMGGLGSVLVFMK